MARPGLGGATRSEVLTIRVTAAEKQFLATGWGTAGKGLRGLLDRAKREAQAQVPRQDSGKGLPTLIVTDGINESRFSPVAGETITIPEGSWIVGGASE